MPLARIAGFLLWAGFVCAQDPSAEAIRQYRQKLAQDPHDSLAHFLLAELLLELRNFQGAANEFRESLNGDTLPPWLGAWAHADLGEIFDSTNQPQRALTEYRFALQVKSDEAAGARAIAVSRISEGLTPSATSLHHVLSPRFRYFKTAKPLVKALARYSQEARIAELEGSVAFFAAVAPDGSTKDLGLTQPLGLGLDEAAKAAAERWPFEAAAPEESTVPRMAPIELDFLLPSKNSRWHLPRVAFDPPDGATPPRFVQARYPTGAGISAAATDEAQLVAAMGRQAVVTLSFVIDPTGHPTLFRVEKSTYPIWGGEAISFVSQWQFAPGAKSGTAVRVPCTVDLAWGEKQLTHASVLRALQTEEDLIH